MNKDKYRLIAFLHDPVYKPFALIQRTGHEKEAIEIISEALGIPREEVEEIIKQVKHSDIFASTTDRPILPAEAPDIRSFNELEFRHPLCGTKFQLMKEDCSGELRRLDPNDPCYVIRYIKSYVVEEIKEIVRDKKSYKEILEALWQELLPSLEDKYSQIPWRLLPADTRVPDHSIWQHLKVSADVDPFGERYAGWLCVFSISPVQKFIRQARKTMDLWAGSYILSRLTFAAMEKVIEDYGSISIIYPDMQGHPWLKGSTEHKEIPLIPNKFVAMIPENDREIVRNLCEKVEQAYFDILTDWVNKAENLFGLKIPREHVDYALSPYWIALGIPKKMEEAIEIIAGKIPEDLESYVEQFVEILETVNLKYGSSKGNSGYLYGPLYTLSEKALAARKTIKDKLFPPPEEGGRERCHVCGERNAIIRYKRKSNQTDQIEHFVNSGWQEISSLQLPRHLKEGEHLCGVCLLKRILPDILDFSSFTFPSTADVAIANIIFESEPNDWLGISRENSHSPSLPYLRKKFGINSKVPEGRSVLEVASGNIKEVPEKDISIIRGVLDKIEKETGKSPNPYYAMISVDGDELGKWISGQKGIELSDETNVYNSHVWEAMDEDFKALLRKLYNSSNRPVTPSYHASLSHALQNFALEMVPLIVEEQHLGRLVYAGGDDVLAMVNLEHLWDVLQLLRGAYSGMVEFEKGKDEEWILKLNKDNKTGIVVKGSKYLITMGPCATLSAGVVIAHYKTPLSIVINRALDLVKVAKEEYGRDAFVVEWIKHSGETTMAGSKWGMLDDMDAIERLKYFARIFSPGRMAGVSKGFVRFLKQVGQKIDYDKELMEPMIKLAVKRYFQEESPVDMDEFVENVESFSDIKELLNFLEIILLQKGRYGNV